MNVCRYYRHQRPVDRCDTMGHEHFEHLRHRLSVGDVRALLKLCNQLHVLAASGVDGVGERDCRKLKLLEGLRALTGADRVSSAVATFREADGAGRRNNGEGRRPRAGTSGGNGREDGGGGGDGDGGDGDGDAEPAVVSAVQLGPAGPSHALPAGPHAAGRAGYVPCPWHAYRAYGRGVRAANARPPSPLDWCTSTTGDDAAAGPAAAAGNPRGAGRARGGRGRGEHFVHSFLPLSDGHLVACLSIGRYPARPRFSSRERSIVCALHAEVAWLYRADVMLLSPETRALSPRERETLQHLLAGKAEKQIALEMGVSFNTIHHYVKSLHRHFGVSTRSELLAQWVGR